MSGPVALGYVTVFISRQIIEGTIPSFEIVNVVTEIANAVQTKPYSVKLSQTDNSRWILFYLAVRNRNNHQHFNNVEISS